MSAARVCRAGLGDHRLVAQTGTHRRVVAASLPGFGVAVTTRCYSGLIHGSFEMSAVVPAARELLQDAAGVLVKALI